MPRVTMKDGNQKESLRALAAVLNKSWNLKVSKGLLPKKRTAHKQLSQHSTCTSKAVGNTLTWHARGAGFDPQHHIQIK
uniref:Uncharacterized protein n=1 Tax=Spermophilus dauricus TaxID=99837 RepID=A0A8C9QB86_SPEDA